jgi:hypothetical protein
MTRPPDARVYGDGVNIAALLSIRCAAQVCVLEGEEPGEVPESRLPLVHRHDLGQGGREALHYKNGPDNVVMGDAPSSYQTFPRLAEVLATRDPSRFCSTLPSNNHWSNWPEAGQL